MFQFSEFPIIYKSFSFISKNWVFLLQYSSPPHIIHMWYFVVPMWYPSLPHMIPMWYLVVPMWYQSPPMTISSTCGSTTLTIRSIPPFLWRESDDPLMKISHVISHVIPMWYIVVPMWYPCAFPWDAHFPTYCGTTWPSGPFNLCVVDRVMDPQSRYVLPMWYPHALHVISVFNLCDTHLLPTQRG